jgi:hypothetical protein
LSAEKQVRICYDFTIPFLDHEQIKRSKEIGKKKDKVNTNEFFGWCEIVERSQLFA